MTKTQALERVESLSRKIVKGETDLESWKWRRAEAMAAAADCGATQREIAQAAGCAQAEVGRHIKVARSVEPGTGSRPSFSAAFDTATGFDRDAAQTRTDNARAKKVLRDAPLEQVEKLIAALPRERQQALAAAAGNQYAKARQEYDEHERNLTPAERREREHATEQITRPVRQAVAGFTALGIVGHLEQATEELRELTADGSLTAKVMRQIERASDVWITEYEFAQQMVGGER